MAIKANFQLFSRSTPALVSNYMDTIYYYRYLIMQRQGNRILTECSY